MAAFMKCADFPPPQLHCQTQWQMPVILSPKRQRQEDQKVSKFIKTHSIPKDSVAKKEIKELGIQLGG